MKKNLIPLAAAAILLMSCGNNQSTKDSVDKADSANAAKSDSSSVKSDSSAAQPTIKADDNTTTFLVKAANGGLAEVKLAQLAKEKSKDTAVLNFAGMMI